MGAFQLAELLCALARLARTEGSHATTARPRNQHTTRHHVFSSRAVLCRGRATVRTAAIRTRPRSCYSASYIRADDGRGLGYRHRRVTEGAIHVAAPLCSVPVVF